MLQNEPYLNHSLLSSYMNVGLILPLEICQLAEKSYYNGQAPLSSVEGFIRQVLGWREFVRGIYNLKMPRYAQMNYFDASEPLPALYWGAPTNMSCLREAVLHTKVHAYSHHIQRLMVTGNFALIAGLNVQQVHQWYLEVYSDAYEWVELPNTLGMALFADGGILASKPYAASGNYIHKMSNFCAGCKYNPKETLGENACPLNALYWDFFARNRSKLEGNPRIPYVFNNWDRFGDEKQKAIIERADHIRALLQTGLL
jgi:deoxyribodipyrimidine photolyase-related protein